MTIEETAQVMDLLTVAYPQFYGGRNAPDPEKALVLWASLFQEEDVGLVVAAVKALIVSDTSGYPPGIGAVKARVRQLTQPRERTEGEAWGLVVQAVKGLDWNHPDRAFQALPEDIRQCVHSPSVLVEWAKTDESVFSTVTASNFQRTYRARCAAQREYAALPSEIQAMLGGTADRMALEVGRG